MKLRPAKIFVAQFRRDVEKMQQCVQLGICIVYIFYNENFIEEIVKNAIDISIALHNSFHKFDKHFYLSQKLIHMNNIIYYLRNKSDYSPSDKDDLIDTLNSKLELFINDNSNLLNIIDSLQNNNSDYFKIKYENDIKSLINDNANLNRTIDRLNRKLHNNLYIYINNFQSELSKEDFDRIDKTSELENDIKNYTKQIQLLQKANELLTFDNDKISNLQNNIISLNNDNKLLKNMNDQLLSDNNLYINQINDLKNSIVSINSPNFLYEFKDNKKNDIFNNPNIDTERKMRNANKRLLDENNLYFNKIKELSLSLKDSLRQNDLIQHNLDSVINDNIKNINEKNNEINNYQNEINQLKLDLRQLRQQLRDRDNDDFINLINFQKSINYIDDFYTDF